MQPVRHVLLAALLLVVVGGPLSAEDFPWRDLLKKPDAWYSTDAGRATLLNTLSHQSKQGDWPKNQDASLSRFTGDRSKIKGTFDNGATIGELRVLARAVRTVGDKEAREAFLKGLDHILEAQYGNGGWPQSAPPGAGYARYITFNDNTMVNLLEFVRDVSRQPEFAFVDQDRREACRRAFDRGIACILKCQVRVADELTVWCAQHDEQSLEPRPARTFELVSLSGAESARILSLLMSIESPTDEVKQAIRRGVAWFERTGIHGIRQRVEKGNKLIEPDPSAPTLWARFYEIDTNRPFFAGRDGVRKYALSEIEAERRNGYAWYGSWGQSVARDFEAWNRRQAKQSR